MMNRSMPAGVLSAVICFYFFVPQVYAQQIPRQEAISIIIGEAADQGLKGMICVGEVLRRRGSTEGFYGYSKNSPKMGSAFLKQMAAKAWDMSANTNYTKGADHFENVKAFGEPWWAKDCIKTFEYKDHVFYKEVRKSRATTFSI